MVGEWCSSIGSWSRSAEIACFVGGYGLAWGLELSRGHFRQGLALGGPLAWATAAVAFQTVYLVHRAADAASLPLSSTQDWLLVGAWALAGVYLYLGYHYPRVAFGWILLPMVLLLIAAAWVFGDVRSFPRQWGPQIWAWIHGLSLLLATMAVLVSFATGLMYLLQVRRLRSRKGGFSRWPLPSLEWLHRTNSRSVALALLLLGVGILSGFVLNLWNLRLQRDPVPLTDPLIVTTLAMFAWLAGCLAVGWVYRPAREGRKVAVMTLLTAVFLLVVLAIFVGGGTRHGQFRQHMPQSGHRLEILGLWGSSHMDCSKMVPGNQGWKAVPPVGQDGLGRKECSTGCFALCKPFGPKRGRAFLG